MIAGLVFGMASYQDSQERIETFARMTVPGTMTVQVDEPGRQVIYYEGDKIVVIDDLVVGIISPGGAPVAVASYQGELVYERPGPTLGRAIAFFDAGEIGAYEVEVRGVEAGQITVGESVARLALPGIFTGLAIAGLSLVAGAAIWLYSILRR